MFKKLLFVILLGVSLPVITVDASVGLTEQVEEDSVVDTEVTCSHSPEYEVTVPKKLSFIGNESELTYTVKVKADLATNTFLRVEPIDQFTRDDGDTSDDVNFILYGDEENQEIKTVIKQDQVIFTQEETSRVNEDGTIVGAEVEGILQMDSYSNAGKYNGSFAFEIEVMTDGVSGYKIPLTISAENCEQLGIARSGNVVIEENYTINGTEYTVTSIADNTFGYCYDITSVSLPDTLERIGEGAFRRCYRMVECNIPDTVKEIGSYAFYNCSKLKNVTLPKVEVIGDHTFYGCSSLVNVTIPEGVKHLGTYAFSQCSNLVYLTLPNSLENIESFAFASNKSLKEIVVPDSVKSLGSHAFNGCSALEKCTLGGTYKYLEGGVFQRCSNLVEVNIPNSVVGISNLAFDSCSSLNLIVPDTITSIGLDAFDDVNNVHMTYKGNTYGAKSINCIPNESGRCAICNQSIGTELYVSLGRDNYLDAGIELADDVIIPNSYEKNGIIYNIVSVDDFLSGNTEITSVTIEEGVSAICNNAFKDCINLVDINLPESVTSMGDYVFYNCSSLVSIHIPEKVGFLGNFAFAYCTNLVDIDLPNNLRSCDSSCFTYCTSLKEFDVSSYNLCYWVNHRAFEGCSSLERVVIPSTQHGVGGYLFKGCVNLKSFEISASVKEIHPYAFSKCTAMDILVVPNNIDNIGENAFQGVKLVHYFGNAYDEFGNQWGAEKIGHYYVNGICNVCGKAEE